MTGNLNLITIDFHNLRQNSKASILLYEQSGFRWCSGDLREEKGGRICIAALDGSALSIRRFYINGREVFLETLGACNLVHQQLYASGGVGELRGMVDLPPEASVTLRSLMDTTSVIGKSSFSLSVKSER